jgi:hypothetical protein
MPASSQAPRPLYPGKALRENPGDRKTYFSQSYDDAFHAYFTVRHACMAGVICRVTSAVISSRSATCSN